MLIPRDSTVVFCTLLLCCTPSWIWISAISAPISLPPSGVVFLHLSLVISPYSFASMRHERDSMMFCCASKMIFIFSDRKARSAHRTRAWFKSMCDNCCEHANVYFSFPSRSESM
ncbi:hypothetical protein BO99DRAFT_50523 [Aspergillus violaceofuscus CBS 115571]|uniref:Uncharacterized protein n=2 Tax=Aspergillus TaxID=5052 RepID=A0A2V5GQY0_ASPV1|nr:hypothetical protein BO99DRAFT_50523 [Aspergillus violaceofuscus CBS 115571]PYI27343.1 hypothetical protein BP00DRAFT_28254 [Aspergillus indologenus CBS 114.80]